MMTENKFLKEENVSAWYSVLIKIFFLTKIKKFLSNNKNMGITRPCTHLHPAAFTSTQLISTFTQLHPPLSSSFQPPPSSLQHHQQYFNQIIARNWVIYPSPFWLKIDTHGILEVLISKYRLRFLKFRPQNLFLGKFGPKNSRLFVLSEDWCT